MDETVPLEAEVPAPELDATAAIGPEDNSTPDTSAEQEAAKVFSQEELDAIVGKRLAREQRKWEREQAQRAPVQRNQDIPDYVDPANAASIEAYAEQLIAQREAAKQQATIAEAYYDREEDIRLKYDDFDQVAYNTNLPVTEYMAQAIQASDIGPEVIYWLGSNPKESGRIAQLPPILQAKEIGKLEANLASNPPVKKTSTAPAPIVPVTARTSGAPAFDTTDPRSIKNMSTSEWIEADRLRQTKKYEAQRNR